MNVLADKVAIVTGASSGIGRVTGSDGRYTLPSVPAGTHAVEARSVGYGMQSVTVTVAAADESAEAGSSLRGEDPAGRAAGGARRLSARGVRQLALLAGDRPGR